MPVAFGRVATLARCKGVTVWDGRFYSFTVCPKANRELYEELAGLAPRARAERLRHLAGLGLFASAGGRPAAEHSTVKPEVSMEPGEDTPTPYANRGRKTAATGLLNSLGKKS